MCRACEKHLRAVLTTWGRNCSLFSSITIPYAAGPAQVPTGEGSLRIFAPSPKVARHSTFGSVQIVGYIPSPTPHVVHRLGRCPHRLYFLPDRAACHPGLQAHARAHAHHAPAQTRQAEEGSVLAHFLHRPMRYRIRLLVWTVEAESSTQAKDLVVDMIRKHPKNYIVVEPYASAKPLWKRFLFGP